MLPASTLLFLHLKEVKVDSLVDEDVAGYVPSTVSTPRSAVSTPRAKTSMVPLELPAAGECRRFAFVPVLLRGMGLLCSEGWF